MTDSDLLERLRQGDASAFDTIFRTWYGPLVGTAERMLRDRAVAEELVQDVMLELWRRRETLSSDGSPQAYLFQATRNRVLNHLRHLKIEQRSEPEVRGEISSTPHADAALVQEELDVAVQRAVQSLPDRCREVFELSRVHGLKYAEIARTLGISVKTVEAQMGKAFRTLRERLAAWLPEGGGEFQGVRALDPGRIKGSDPLQIPEKSRFVSCRQLPARERTRAVLGRCHSR